MGELERAARIVDAWPAPVQINALKYLVGYLSALAETGVSQCTALEPLLIYGEAGAILHTEGLYFDHDD